MLTQGQAIFFQWISVFAILISPVIAVCVTLWYQSVKEKNKEKTSLFLTLIATRKSNVESLNFVSRVNALNTIDVVFHGNNSVVHAWHDFYSMLNLPQENVNQKELEHKWLDLLDVMARSLGYEQLKQTDLDKFYSPQGWETQSSRNYDIQVALLKFLKKYSEQSPRLP